MAMATEFYKSRQLTPKQLIALAEIIKGKTDEETARAAGVHRATVSEWKNHDPLFIQELHKQLNAIHRAAIAPFADRLRELADSSLDTILRAVKNGDTTSARWYLDKVIGLGEIVTGRFVEVTTPPELLPEDVETIVTQIAGRVFNCIIEEEGITELDVLSRPELMQRIRKNIITSINQDYFGGETQ